MSDSTNITVDGGFDSLNSTVVKELNRPSAFDTLRDVNFMLLEVKLVLSALGIIYLGTHAAIRRPPSAAPTSNKKRSGKDNEERYAQGLEPTDAIMFPLMAGLVLAGLYYLIQWLQDPDILNKILRWYMSTMSLASLLALFAHGIEVVTSLVFPRFWRGRDGVVREVDQKSKAVMLCDGTSRSPSSSDQSPLPGLLAWLAPSAKARQVVWEVRHLLTRKWTVKFFVHGFVSEEKGRIKFAHVLALFMAVATALIYSSTSSTFLSNTLGYGMCYGSFLVLSPTDFLTSTLVLTGLFFYDIIMVFYTPYMITVATTLEVPVKLTFQAAERRSILGLGDIVIPGLVIGLALRFDLWLHYQRKIKYEATDLTLVEKDPSSGEIVSRSQQKHKEVKARYVNVKGAWGDLLWTRGALFLVNSRQLPAELQATRFPKVYFYASMVGYSAGMLATLAALLITNHGQPALLYLVPGVLGSLWLTGLARGEIKQMWKYTEDGSIDTEDVVVDLDGYGNAIKTIGELKDGIVDTTKDKKKDSEDAAKEVAKKAAEDKKGHQVFLLSVDAPSDDEES